MNYNLYINFLVGIQIILFFKIWFAFSTILIFLHAYASGNNLVENNNFYFLENWLKIITKCNNMSYKIIQILKKGYCKKDVKYAIQIENLEICKYLQYKYPVFLHYFNLFHFQSE